MLPIVMWKTFDLMSMIRISDRKVTVKEKLVVSLKLSVEGGEAKVYKQQDSRSPRFRSKHVLFCLKIKVTESREVKEPNLLEVHCIFDSPHHVVLSSPKSA